MSNFKDTNTWAALQEQYSGDFVVMDSWRFDGWSTLDRGACLFSSPVDAAETLDKLRREGRVGGSVIVVVFVRDDDEKEDVT